MSFRKLFTRRNFLATSGRIAAATVAATQAGWTLADQGGSELTDLSAIQAAMAIRQGDITAEAYAAALPNTRARAKHQLGHQRRCPGHLRQNRRNLARCHHHGDALALLNTIEAIHLGERRNQHIPIEKDNRIQGLRLGRGSDFALNRQMVQKLRHFGLSKLPRMPLAMEEDELPNPEPISLFCACTEVPASADRMNLVHQTGRRGDGVALRGLAGRTPLVSLLVEGENIHSTPASLASIILHMRTGSLSASTMNQAVIANRHVLRISIVLTGIGLVNNCWAAL